MNKKAIVTLIVEELNKRLLQAEQAANNAHLAAIDDQSVAETQYDTLAIEASYLAEGQSRRIELLKGEIASLTSLEFNAEHQQISLGSLVALEDEREQLTLLILLPVAGGQEVIFKGKKIQVVTPNAPLAQQMLGLAAEDEFSVTIAGKEKTYFIESIC